MNGSPIPAPERDAARRIAREAAALARSHRRLDFDCWFWWLHGALFRRHWIAFWTRATWWGWFRRWRSRIYAYPGVIRKSPPHRLFCDWLDYQCRMFCPHCGCEGFDFYQAPWFECDESGSYGTCDGTVHWFRGTQTCPRCTHSFPVEDSS